MLKLAALHFYHLALPAPLLMLAVPPIADNPGWVAGSSAFVLMLFALESRRGLGAALTVSRVRLRRLWKALGRRQRALAGARPDRLNRP
jgi:hypothetical protein